MTSGIPGGPSTEERIRFGYHWGFWKQDNRIGRAIENGKNITDSILKLKGMLRPFWRDNEKWQKAWEQVKVEINKNDNLNEKQKRAKLRREQYNLLMDLAFDNGLMVDKGIPQEHIDQLERRE